MSWREFADWAKRNPWALNVAERLGRGRGRTRFLDSLSRPPSAPVRPDLRGWEDRTLSAVWIGHATLLLRVGDYTILTDPVFAPRVGMGLGLITVGPQRHFAPAISINQLPKIDLMLLSHAHFDHLDRPTLARLPRRTPIVISGGNADLVRDLGYQQITELRWGEKLDLPGLRVTAVPVQHWGARTFFDTHRGYAAYLIESPKYRVLFGADTAFHEGFKSLGKVELAILGIGAYNPYLAAHASPEQAWEMAGHVRADLVVPMHHSTFRLSHEPMSEPIERLRSAAGREEDRIVIRRIGETFTL